MDEILRDTMKSLGISGVTYEVADLVLGVSEDMYEKTGDEKWYLIRDEIEEYIENNF